MFCVVVLPIVPMFKCGLLREYFSAAASAYPLREAAYMSVPLCERSLVQIDILQQISFLKEERRGLGRVVHLAALHAL